MGLLVSLFLRFRFAYKEHFCCENPRMVGVGRDLCGSPSATPLTEAGSPRAGCTGPCPGGAGISPEKDTPQPPWAPWARAPSPSEGRSSSSCSDRMNSHFLHSVNQRGVGLLVTTYACLSLKGLRKAGSDTVEAGEFSLTFLHPVVQRDCVQLSRVAAVAVFLEGLNHFG